MLQFTEKETEPELDPARINETIINFQQIITSAADKSFGIPRLQKIRKIPVAWWNEECKIAMQESHYAFNRVKKHPTNENLTEFKKKRANFRRIIKENKKRSWRNYITLINPQTSASAVWNKIRSINGSNPLRISNSWNLMTVKPQLKPTTLLTH